MIKPDHGKLFRPYTPGMPVGLIAPREGDDVVADTFLRRPDGTEVPFVAPIEVIRKWHRLDKPA